MASLEEPLMKLRRAHDHLYWLHQATPPILGRQLDHLVQDVTDEGTEYTFSFAEIEEPDPAWTLVVGDCLFNARASLDYLVFQLYEHFLGANFTPKMQAVCMFPIFENPPAPNDKDAWRRVEHLPTPIRNEIQRLQPYTPGQPDFVRDLGMLNRMQIIDKHRRMHFGWHVGRVFPSQGLTTEYGFREESLTGPVERGKPFARWMFDDSPPRGAFRAAATVRIFVNDGGTPTDLLSALGRCLYAVGATLNEFASVLPAS